MLSLPDDGDRHALAAAIKCQADMIITFNLKDFPHSVLEPLGIVAIHPDDFVVNELNGDWPSVCKSVKIVRARLKNPPRSVDEYLATLEQQGLAETVRGLREVSHLL